MKTKCQTCTFGAMKLGFRGSVYSFKLAIKKVENKIIEINYKKGELGCRMSDDIEKQKECLNNNFNKYENFDLLFTNK